MEKQNRFVRFHAMQSLLSAAAVIVIEVVLSVLNHIPFIDLLSIFLLGRACNQVLTGRRGLHLFRVEVLSSMDSERKHKYELES